jgi:phospholipid/cholesterol/gamma-HCH transport system substrate-binding protein
MENHAHAFFAGLFVILLSIAVVIIAMWFTGDSVLRNSYLVVSNESVTGLHAQAAVHYRGVTIGNVERIYFNPENSHQILIEVSIYEDIFLTEDVYAQLGYQGLTGMAFIQLNDQGNTSVRLEEDAHIPMHRSFISEMAGSGQHLLHNVDRLVNKAHTLLSDDNQIHFAHILTNLEKVTQHFDSVAIESQAGIKSLTTFTDRTNVVLGHLDTLLLEMNQIIIKANRQGGIIDNLSQSAEELTITLPKLNEVNNSIVRSARNFDRVLHQLEQHPQSLLFGKPPMSPDPGEHGFIPPLGTTRP